MKMTSSCSCWKWLPACKLNRGAMAAECQDSDISLPVPGRTEGRDAMEDLRLALLHGDTPYSRVP